MDQKSLDEVMERLIKDASLRKNKRKAVIYFDNIGDWYCLCATVKYAEIFLNQKFVLLYTSEIHKEIASWFSYDDYNIELFYLPHNEYYILSKADRMPELYKKYEDYIITWFSENTQFTQITKQYDPNFKYHVRKPNLPHYELSYFERKYGIVENKTIIINPMTTSAASPPDWFWNFCANSFEMLGYKVFFNVGDKEKNRFNKKNIFPPISEMVSLLNYSGYFITVRSGILDMVITTRANIVVFSCHRHKPVDEIYGLLNDNNRILTYYYDDNDYFFEKSSLISEIYKYYNERSKSALDIIHSMSQISIEDINEIDSPNIITAYRPRKDNHKIVINDSFKIENFFDIKYVLKQKNNNIVFKILNFNKYIFRIDIYVYYERDLIIELQDYNNGSLVFKPKYTGNYYIKTIIYDKKTFKNEHFTTKELFFKVIPPKSQYELLACNDYHIYIESLTKFKRDLIIIIASRDCHTSWREEDRKYKDFGLSAFVISTDLRFAFRESWLCIIDSGRIVKELHHNNETVKALYYFDENKAEVSSSGWNVRKSPDVPISIKINEKELAVNRRGLNFVIWDKKINRVIDSVCFDTFNNDTAYR